MNDMEQRAVELETELGAPVVHLFDGIIRVDCSDKIRHLTRDDIDTIEDHGFVVCAIPIASEAVDFEFIGDLDDGR